ncbi:winged helix-turn-helix domain-containing protein [Catenovulum sp. SM1970]|uniref:winged helix-turn-helix domain-containing protein n=1 Tax=Marinifaba aquimaris TaxID=2741323 RepID=UPI001573AD51|nr:winged helix-turn-helix domain-containing protein [Marinifaba aquimaris]NTS76148.1 winged helix-turn-helix domain-containing protein [Marinifaba aquimaris]
MNGLPANRILINKVVVDFAALKLKVNGQWRQIEARTATLLKLLVEQHGQSVSRQTIMDTLWPDTIVSDNSVSQAITQLRKALGEESGQSQFIRTVPRVGYQLIAEIEVPQSLNEQAEQVVKNQSVFVSSLLAAGLIIGVVATWLSLYWLEEEQIEYQYISRITSAPGAENNLSYSTDDRYIAYSQYSSDQSNRDLIIYDSTNFTLNAIRSSHFNEDMPTWSPDGNWLIYRKYNAFSCQYQLLSIRQPVEMWRLSEDKTLFNCSNANPNAELIWHKNNQLLLQDNGLFELTIDFDSRAVTEQKILVEIEPTHMAISPDLEQLLLVTEQPTNQIVVFNLTNKTLKTIKQSAMPFWGITWQDNDHFWYGHDKLYLTNFNSHILFSHATANYVTDLTINNQQQLAIAEGIANVNVYPISIKQNQANIGHQLSSSTRFDILPNISPDANQIVYFSFSHDSQAGIEIWLKHKRKNTTQRLSQLPINVIPQYSLWSPDNNHLLIVDQQGSLHLLNIQNQKLTSVLASFVDISDLIWHLDGDGFYFTSKLETQTSQLFYYELGLKAVTSADQVNITKWQSLNPSTSDYLIKVSQHLSPVLLGLKWQEAEEEEQAWLLDNLTKYQPAISQEHIFFIISERQQLSLFRFNKSSEVLDEIATIGRDFADIDIVLNIASSSDGQSLVISKVDSLESDIFLLKPKAE